MIGGGFGHEKNEDTIRNLPLNIPGDVARELALQNELIEPIRDTIVKLKSILPTMDLDGGLTLAVIRDPGAYPKPRFQIVVHSTKPIPSEHWMKKWNLLSSSIDEPMRTPELRRRVLLYLDPGW
jgi:hypothetical protein